MNLMAESFNFFNCLLDGERFKWHKGFSSYFILSNHCYHANAFCGITKMDAASRNKNAVSLMIFFFLLSMCLSSLQFF